MESLFGPQQGKSLHSTNGWEEVEIYKESCSAWSHHLLQQQLWLQQFVYPDLSIAPKMGTGTPADAQVKRLWQGILTSVRRPLAVLSAKMDANVMAGRGGCCSQWQPDLTQLSDPPEPRPLVWAWLLSTPGEKKAVKHSEKARHKGGQFSDAWKVFTPSGLPAEQRQRR